jgi:hypothetical protein
MAITAESSHREFMRHIKLMLKTGVGLRYALMFMCFAGLALEDRASLWPSERVGFGSGYIILSSRLIHYLVPPQRAQHFVAGGFGFEK